MLSHAHLQAMRTIAGGLRGQPVEWAFTGSAAVALQGVDVPCRDLDVQTSAPGAVRILECFAAAATGEVREIRTAHMRAQASYLQLEGIRVELLAEIMSRGPKGRWERSRLEPYVTWIDVAPGLPAPVLNLQRMLAINESMERLHTAQAIRHALACG
ncbi:MAG TPA: hypothetical protein VNS09_05370 [Solirubrobacter sp.]|nr:hypothetical protein [Solirubrobacter sp.]